MIPANNLIGATTFQPILACHCCGISNGAAIAILAILLLWGIGIFSALANLAMSVSLKMRAPARLANISWWLLCCFGGWATYYHMGTQLATAGIFTVPVLTIVQSGLLIRHIRKQRSEREEPTTQFTELP